MKQKRKQNNYHLQIKKQEVQKIMKVNKPMTISEYFNLNKNEKEKILIGKVKYNSDGKTYNFLISDEINREELKPGVVVLVNTSTGRKERT